MTIPGLPPERQSLYPEPYLAGGWDPAAQTRRSRGWLIPIIGAAIAAVALATWAGFEVGHKQGTAALAPATNTSPAAINAIQAGVGTCLEKLPKNGLVATAKVVACSVPHRAEIVSDYAFTGDTWPGRDEVVSTLVDFCGSFVQPGYSDSSMFAATDWDDGLRWVAWAPTERSWADNERTGMCVVYRDGQITGSFVDSSATFVN